MRLSDDNIFARKDKNEFRRCFFIAFEGTTEYIYFKGIKDNKEKLRISNTVDIQCIDRFDQNSGDSNPSVIIGPLSEYRELIKSGDYSIRLFVGTIIQSMFEFICRDHNSAKKNECRRKLHRIQNEMITALKDSGLCEDNIVNRKKWTEATDICRKIIEMIDPSLKEYIAVPIDRKMETYDPDVDRFCLVIDRDKKSTNKEMYHTLLSNCNDNDISLFVTNPAFEFWLLSHNEKCRSLDQRTCDDLLENRSIIEGDIKRSYAEQKLIEVYGSYSKIDVDFKNRYLDNINKAIENMESFETDLNKLECKLGSNIGHLIEEMRKSNI